MMANEEKLELMKKLSTMSDLSDDRMERGKLISSESMATMVEMRQIGRPPRVRTCSRN